MFLHIGIKFGTMVCKLSYLFAFQKMLLQVLLQTRSDMVRTRILGLRIVKYLLENLKEEYLVLLAETIPFLGELLEDVELSVKSLAQEILKDMEFLSGESLQEYL